MIEGILAKDIMVGEVICVKDDMGVSDLARFLSDKAISGAPVVNARGKLVGVVSVTDLARTQSGNNSVSGYQDFERNQRFRFDEVPQMHMEAEGTFVRDIMTQALFSVRPETPVSEVADMMVRGRVHRLLVTDDRERLLGMVTTLDLVKLLTNGYAKMD